MTTPTLTLYDFPASICCQMARLALAEKGARYARRTVDIMERAEQFEPWYLALNPRAVTPTLDIGGEIVTDTIAIVTRIDADLEGPALTPADPEAAEAMRGMMREVMGLHYGVLLYSRRLAPDRTSPTVVARGRFLAGLRDRRPDQAGLLARRIEGNARMQAILADPEATARHEAEARALVGRLEAALDGGDFVCGDAVTLADAFAAAALARFRLHGFESWWTGGASPRVAAYYRRMKARPSWAEAGVIDSGSERDI